MARLVLGHRLAHAAKGRPWLHGLVWWTEAMLIGAGLRLCSLLPVDGASAFGRRLIGAIGPRLAKHGKFLAVLRIAFPERSPAELEKLATAIWGNVGAVMAEYGHLKTICGDQADERLKIEIHPGLRACRSGGRPAVFVAAHLSNFEICAAAIRQMAGPVTIVYKPLKNPWLDKMLAKYRRTMGCRLISSDLGPCPLLRELRAGRSIGIVMDQRHPGGTPIPFFGLRKPTTIVPARLALRCGADFIPVRAERLMGSRFRVTFHEPVPQGDPNEPEIERALGMTSAVHALFEEWIRACPRDWLPMRLAKGADVASPAPEF